MALFLIQVLNGLQFGVLLFLIAAGLTLVFGVMNFINLAHGTQYMLGAYLAVAFYGIVGTFVGALLLALVAALVCGLMLEFLVFRQLYERDHLVDQAKVKLAPAETAKCGREVAIQCERRFVFGNGLLPSVPSP